MADRKTILKFGCLAIGRIHAAYLPRTAEVIGPESERPLFVTIQNGLGNQNCSSRTAIRSTFAHLDGRPAMSLLQQRKFSIPILSTTGAN